MSFFSSSANDIRSMSDSYSSLLWFILNGKLSCYDSFNSSSSSFSSFSSFSSSSSSFFLFFNAYMSGLNGKSTVLFIKPSQSTSLNQGWSTTSSASFVEPKRVFYSLSNNLIIICFSSSLIVIPCLCGCGKIIYPYLINYPSLWWFSCMNGGLPVTIS